VNMDNVQMHLLIGELQQTREELAKLVGYHRIYTRISAVANLIGMAAAVLFMGIAIVIIFFSSTAGSG